MQREVERLSAELERENEKVAKAEIARIKLGHVGQEGAAGNRTAEKPKDSTRGSNDACQAAQQARKAQGIDYSKWDKL